METAVNEVPGQGAGEAGLLDRARIVAKPGFNRWFVPPAALAIHLSIGMAYGLSVFWLPLNKAIGLAKPAACPNLGFFDALTTTTCDWPVSSLLLTFEIGIVFLGLSAAVFGGWLERAGPRKAGVVSALCWGGGFLIGAYAISIHQLWLLWLGLGVVGGIGLGLGYISPVSTLIKWFPDRRGMATGMAIMGFGGGAMIGSPLANILINYFKTPESVGVWQTFVVFGLGYLVVMLIGAFGYRVPPDGWEPEGWTATAHKSALVTSGAVHLNDAHKTRSFWMIWAVLFLNVSAGIAVLSMASPMLQEIFAGKLIGLPDLTFSQLSADQLKAIAGIAAGFVGLLSLFNIGGRFFWASLSDRIGRKATYFAFFGLGIALYASAPTFAHMGSKALFVGAFCIILSMYGGGFATVPAYLADIFGTKFVGAIHGRLLTAWSAAGVVGAEVIGRVRDAQIAAGVPKAQVYDKTMYIVMTFLIVGFICNALVRPVHVKWLMNDAGHRPGAVAAPAVKLSVAGNYGIGKGSLSGAALVPWVLIAIPIIWGIWKTLEGAVRIFS
jgi:MFS family permease